MAMMMVMMMNLIAQVLVRIRSASSRVSHNE